MGEKKKKKKTYRRYDKEFKISAVKLALEDKRSESAISKDLGIRRNVLNQWKQQYLKYNEDAFNGPECTKLEKIKVNQLNKRISDLEEENEILKKALAIFSKKSGQNLSS